MSARMRREVGALLTQRGVPGLRRGRELHRRAGGSCRPGRCASAASRSAAADRRRAAPTARGSLDEAEASSCSPASACPCAREIVVGTMPPRREAAARELGGRVVLKILSREITHKSDVGGVRGRPDAETDSPPPARPWLAEVRAKPACGPERFLVQEMVSGGTELILGMHRDPRSARPSCWAWAASPRSCSRTPRCACCRRKAA